jgi:hypothetical protein
MVATDDTSWMRAGRCRDLPPRHVLPDQWPRGTRSTANLLIVPGSAGVDTSPLSRRPSRKYGRLLASREAVINIWTNRKQARRRALMLGEDREFLRSRPLWSASKRIPSFITAVLPVREIPDEPRRHSPGTRNKVASMTSHPSTPGSAAPAARGRRHAWPLVCLCRSLRSAQTRRTNGNR